MSANEEIQPNRPKYFLWTAPIAGALATIAVVKPALFTNTITDVSKFFYMKFDWLIMWLPLLAFTVCMVVALSPPLRQYQAGRKRYQTRIFVFLVDEHAVYRGYRRGHRILRSD